MNRDEFNKLLKKANLNKKKLSEILGTSYQGVNSWGSNGRGYPYWVKSWLENYIKASLYDSLTMLGDVKARAFDDVCSIVDDVRGGEVEE